MGNTYRSMMVKISAPLLKKLKLKLDSAFLKRDPFLNSVFKHEAEELANETFCNTDEAKKYFFREFLNSPELELKPVNLSLEKDTIEAINNACKARKSL